MKLESQLYGSEEELPATATPVSEVFSLIGCEGGDVTLPAADYYL